MDGNGQPDELYDLHEYLKGVGDEVNRWMEHHDEVFHGGDPCQDERANVLAYLCHRMGYNRETIELMLHRILDYQAMHQEHEHGGTDAG